MPMLESVPLHRQKIRQLRKAKGWTLADAAREAGMNSGEQWRQIEAGIRRDPSISTIERMAKALGVTVNDLLAPEGGGQPCKCRVAD